MRKGQKLITLAGLIKEGLLPSVMYAKANSSGEATAFVPFLCSSLGALWSATV